MLTISAMRYAICSFVSVPQRSRSDDFSSSDFWLKTAVSYTLQHDLGVVESNAERKLLFLRMRNKMWPKEQLKPCQMAKKKFFCELFLTLICS